MYMCVTIPKDSLSAKYLAIYTDQIIFKNIYIYLGISVPFYIS